jgi:hypothetical protein
MQLIVAASRDGVDLITAAGETVQDARERQYHDAQTGRHAKAESAREETAPEDRVLKRRRKAHRARRRRYRLNPETRLLEDSPQTGDGEMRAMAWEVEVVPAVPEASALS